MSVVSTWQLDPAGIQAVLTSVSTTQGELGEAMTEEAVTGVFEGLTWGGVVTSEVPKALSALMNDQQAHTTVISNRINAGILGVMNATLAYNQGQEEMASEFQRELTETAADGDFSYFEQHGYGEGE